MSDQSTTVAELRRLVSAFVDERDWRQFHDAKNLSMSLAIEAAELMEHFQWLRSDELPTRLVDAETRRRIAEEMADVGSYLLALANSLEIDLSTAIRDKIRQNAQRYPVELSRGRADRPEVS
ncbi:MAG: nucleotide pyrophosphohydrolase [Phycisphaerales bacterium]|nr:nucleotide pyrophosphohydrolase [Phycisphaerales bacterium]